MRRAAEIVVGFGLALGATAAASRAATFQAQPSPIVEAPPSPFEGSPSASALPLDAPAAALPLDAPAADAPAAPPDSLPAWPEAWKAIPPIGPAYDDDAALPGQAAAVASYEMEATLDVDAHSIEGKGTITWRNASRVPQREVWVHLYLNGFKNQETLFARSSTKRNTGTGWGYIDVKRFHVQEMDEDVWPARDRTSPGDRDDETDIRVPLPREVAPGETIHIDVAWDSQLPQLTSRTGFAGAFHMVAQWFPKLAKIEPDGTWAHFPFHSLAEFHADFGLYDVTVDAPAGVVIGATGMLAEEERSGDRQRRRYVQENIHDFVFVAWEGFKIEERKSDGGVVVKCLFPPGHDEAAAAELDAALFGLEHYGKAYGKYPYGKLLLVHPPPNAQAAAGMEYPMLITTGGSWYTPHTGARYAELVTMHELGHQWFYGLVATDEHASPFLDEGLTSYAEAAAMEARYPGSSVYQGFGLSIGDPAVHRAGSASASHDNAVAEAATSFTGRFDYGAIVYYRASTIFSTFERVYGEDLVARALGRYARRYRFEHPGPEHLLGAFREVLGDDAAEALRASLFDRGWIDLAVQQVTQVRKSVPEGVFGDPTRPSSPRENLRAGEWHADIVVRRRGTLALPVEVAIGFEDGSTERIPWDGKKNLVHLPYVGKSRVASVVIDPDHRVLLDGDLANNAWSSRPRLVAPRVLERASFAAGVALGLGAP